jgi:hypothetical protein
MRKIETIDCGGGFKIDRRPQRTWTEWRAYHVDASGLIVNERGQNFSRRRDAEAQIAQWKTEGENR